MKPILEIQNVSKRFPVYHKNLPYLSFRERLTGLFKPSETVEEFWALNDVSCTVQAGESIGIIGRNGAGKSTLLKILSRITPPTTGRIVSRGRIASLLEVGTGFHQELSGRENIYMNGSILGMKKWEINKRFDEIVDFSGTEHFLDTPLKHYSSGMQLRLAFAVAAHLEPEILIIDEVLAVGDAEFQKKCIRKMENVSGEGRTILVVSHQLNTIHQLCKKTLWIEKGAVKQFGPTDSIINQYITKESDHLLSAGHLSLGKGVMLRNFRVDPSPATALTNVTFSFEIGATGVLGIESIGLYISNIFQERVAIVDLRQGEVAIAAGQFLRYEVKVNNVPLVEGEYNLGLFLGSNLLNGNFDGLGKLVVLPRQRNSNIMAYPVEHRGKIELDYEFISQGLH